MSLLEGKIVLVSGGTRGLGAGIASAAVQAGAAGVMITGRDRSAAEQVQASLHRAPVAFTAVDLVRSADAIRSVTETVERFGRVDCVVNAAGLTTRGTLIDTTPELFDQHIAINLRAPFLIMQQAVIDMRARSAPGTIVNIISMSALGGQPYLAPYVAAKSGLIGLTKNAAHAHRFDRIRINGLNIGWTETEGEDATQRRFHGAGDDWVAQAAAKLPMGKLGQVDEIADMVIFLLSDRSGVVTGSVIDWDQNVPGAHD